MTSSAAGPARWPERRWSGQVRPTTATGRDLALDPRAVLWVDGAKVSTQPVDVPSIVQSVNRRGEIASRMNGYVPERFVETLSTRIKEALAEN